MEQETVNQTDFPKGKGDSTKLLREDRAARLIAFYLPQFHPIPENDVWWGKGFTEWTNVAKAKPFFPRHHQPHVPADLGFYDLRVPEVRIAQAKLARESGIEGFCYWHYWFAGKRLLERPFNEVLQSGEPDFPFCLGWANQTWTGIWHGAPKKILIEQTYPGRDDYEKHFFAVLHAFQDPRYIRVNGKPIFVIYRPTELPNAREFFEIWNKLSEKNGIAGIHFVAHTSFGDDYDYLANGFSAAVASDTFAVSRTRAWRRASRLLESRSGGDSATSLLRLPAVLAKAIKFKVEKHWNSWLSKPRIFDYEEAMLYLLDSASSNVNSYPSVVPNWDNSPRSGKRAIVLRNSTPELFRQHLQAALRLVADRSFENRIVFVKSWNEWAEGNYLEPDLQFGHQYLHVVREEVFKSAETIGKRRA